MGCQLEPGGLSKSGTYVTLSQPSVCAPQAMTITGRTAQGSTAYDKRKTTHEHLCGGAALK
jgi:hypothetical protein